MKKLLLVFLFSPIFTLSQNLDSLWGVWNDKSQADTNRLKAMLDIASDGFLYTQPDSAFYYAQMMYDFAEEKNEKKYMAKALNTQGGSFYVRGNYLNAIDYFSRSLKIYKELGDKTGMSASLNNIGIIYDIQGDYFKAVNYYTESLTIAKEQGDKQSISRTLGNIGVIAYNQGDYVKAIDCYTQTLKIVEELGDKKMISSSLNNIGLIYTDQGDHIKAIDYFTQSLKNYENLGDKKGISSVLNNIGVAYKNQQLYTKAIEHFNRSLNVANELGDQQSVSNSLNNIGNIYKNKGEKNKAIDFYSKSLAIYKELEDKQGASASLNNIGNIYREQGNYLKALEYSNKSLTIAHDVGITSNTRSAAESLWKTNKILGNYKSALEMHELYIKMRDSILSEENKKGVIRQEYKYAYEKQAAKDSVKHSETQKVKDALIAKQGAEADKQEAELKNKRNQQYALFGGIALLILFLGFIYNRFRVTRKQKYLIETAHEQLEEKNTEIMDSINYAKRIQSAILPPSKLVKEYLQQSFILYKPKDVVAGDFYWMEHREGKVLFAAADCTGHGVPGAMVSVVCNNGLNRSVREHGLTDPGKILDKTREIVIQEFEKSEEEVKDGMDIALCSLEGMKLKYAGAHNPLWIIRNGEIIETKANKQPIGKFDKQTAYTTHSFDLEVGDAIYIFSDGYVDQFGGEKGKKFKAKAFRELLLSIQDKPMEAQKIIIDDAFEAWRGDLEQIDDVCVIGVRV